MTARLRLAAVILLLAAGIEPARAQEQPPAPPQTGIIVEQTAFEGGGGLTLAGTLTLPPGHGRPAAGWPALVLVQGSGPTDRDGNQPPYLRTDLLREIAEYLAGRGIASLRYDKRGMHANLATLPASREDYAAFFRWENFVADAAGALRHLRQTPGLNPERIGMLGHSEGGLIALDLSSRGEAPPAVLVLAAAPGRKLDAILTAQIDRALTEQKASPAQRKAMLAANSRILNSIRSAGRVPADVPQGLAAIYPFYVGPFLQAELALDPADLARRYDGPVLVLQGQADLQISAEHDAPSLDNALSARTVDKHQLRLFPRLSHAFKPVQRADEHAFEGPVAAEMLDTLGTWLAATLQAQP